MDMSNMSKIDPYYEAYRKAANELVEVLSQSIIDDTAPKGMDHYYAMSAVCLEACGETVTNFLYGKKG